VSLPWHFKHSTFLRFASDSLDTSKADPQDSQWTGTIVCLRDPDLEV